jgi:hypothetical protein
MDTTPDPRLNTAPEVETEMLYALLDDVEGSLGADSELGEFYPQRPAPPGESQADVDLRRAVRRATRGGALVRFPSPLLDPPHAQWAAVRAFVRRAAPIMEVLAERNDIVATTAESAFSVASDGAFSSLTSESQTLTVVPAPLSKYSILNPSTGVTGVFFAVTVTAMDAYGNTRSGASALTLTVNGGAGTLSRTWLNLSSGQAWLTDEAYDQSGTIKLVASDGVISSVLAQTTAIAFTAPTATPSFTPTPTPTSSVTPSISPTDTFTMTSTISPTPTFTATVTPTFSETSTVSLTFTDTSTISPTFTHTSTLSLKLINPENW